MACPGCARQAGSGSAESLQGLRFRTRLRPPSVGHAELALDVVPLLRDGGPMHLLATYQATEATG